MISNVGAKLLVETLASFQGCVVHGSVSDNGGGRFFNWFRGYLVEFVTAMQSPQRQYLNGHSQKWRYLHSVPELNGKGDCISSEGVPKHLFALDAANIHSSTHTPLTKMCDVSSIR